MDELNMTSGQPIIAPHRRTAFWTVLACFIVSGLFAIVLAIIMAPIWQSVVLSLAVLAVIITSILNHRHNHHHLTLLGAATIITLLLGIFWFVQLLNP